MRSQDHSSFHVMAVLSVLLPLGVYVIFAAPNPTWLDSGEFLATGFALGAAHPPGHPLFVLFVKLASFVPAGSIAFRAALLSGSFAALACYATYRISLDIFRSVDSDASPWVGSFFSLVAAWSVGLSPALWAQATRVEVYSLQLALVALAFHALTRYAAPPRAERDGRWLAAFGLWFGLSLANHHFLSFLLVPGVIVLLTEDALGSWRRTLRMCSLGMVPAAAVGLLPYAHLFARSHAPGAVSLGTATSGQDFFWVLSARAFQRAVTEPPTTELSERATEAALLVTHQTGVIVAVLSLGGLYFLIRQRLALGLLFVLAMVASWLARSWLGFDPHNPDVLGYLLVPVWVLLIGASRIGPLVATIIPAKRTVRIGAATVIFLALLGTALWSGVDALHRSNVSTHRGADVMARGQLYSLPPRAVVITELFHSGFNLWAAQMVEGMRPDVAHFHLQFVGFPGYAYQVHQEHRDLRGIIRSLLASGHLEDREVSALAQRRPVFLEPTLDTPESLAPFLLPRGPLWEAAAEPLSITDLRLSVEGHLEAWDGLLDQLGDAQWEDQTLRVVLWRLYLDSLLMARRGERQGASATADRALHLSPSSAQLLALRAALVEQEEGPMDITPFLPPSARHDEPEAAPEEDQDDRPSVLDF